MFGQSDIPPLEDKISRLRLQIDNAQARVRGLLAYARRNAEAIPGHFEDRLRNNTHEIIRVLADKSVHQFMAWDHSLWSEWQPPVFDPNMLAEADQSVPRYLRIGQLTEARDNGDLSFTVPAMIPFIGADRAVIIKTGEDNYEEGLGLLKSLVIRTSLMLPFQTMYTLLDPAGLGAAFPMRRHLPQVRENSGDVRRDLEYVIQDIQRIHENYLDASYPRFELLNPEIRLNERFQLVFAADFPHRYDRRAIEALQNIANTGPRAGTYVFVHFNTRNALPRDVSMAEFRNALTIDLTGSKPKIRELELTVDSAPNADLQNQVFSVLNTAKPQESRVDWDTAVGLPEERWWSQTVDTVLVTPIGVRGASGELNLWFGANKEGRPCAHGMLGAMTGAGKSNLYHVFILGLAVRYSPDEVRFFLIDGKDGVEFQPYRNLPHAEVVSLKSSPQLSRSVLQEVVAERERRNELFARLGVTDITGYRRAGQPQGKLPRILLLIDEYQELFEGDNDGMASNLLLQIAQQGRSAGIHMLLGSQRFGAVGMLNQTAIFGNIHLRLAMQMTNADVQALTEFGRRGKQLIASCDLPGKIVVNDHSGDDGANEMGKVAFLTDERQREIIARLEAKAASSHDINAPVTIVFDGQAQPNLVENPYVEYLLRQPDWLTASQFQEMARRPVHAEGLNIVDWFMAEHPSTAWMGQDFSVRGQAMMVLRRRAAEHVMLIGGSNDAVRYGLTGAILASLCLNAPPEAMEFLILDRSIPGTAWSTTLQDAANILLKPAGYTYTFYRENRDVESALDHLLGEVKRRRELTEEELMDEPSLFAIMTELDRVDHLRRRADSYGMSTSPLGDKLMAVCVEGASLGVHLLLSFSGVRPMTYVIDERQGLLNFQHRIALQMSEDESLTFVRSRMAAQLQAEGALPIVGLYMNVERDRTIRFKPYTVEATIDYNEQLRRIGARLTEWSRKLS
jgi:S-DNA-T family DNA segregation ATPase FtsK/SpoIIIE